MSRSVEGGEKDRGFDRAGLPDFSFSLLYIYIFFFSIPSIDV